MVEQAGNSMIGESETVPNFCGKVDTAKAKAAAKDSVFLYAFSNVIESVFVLGTSVTERGVWLLSERKFESEGWA